MDNWKAAVGARLKETREALDPPRNNQAAIAEFLGIAQTTVSAWERGVAAPRDDLRPRIAEFLGVPVTWLFSYDPDDTNGDEDERAAS